VLAYVLISMSLALGADTVMNADDPVEVDPIVVVGQREPVRLSRAVNSSIVLTPERVAGTFEDNLLTNLANSYASVSITTVSGVGYGLGSRGQGKLLIRGLGFAPNRGTLVIVDGRPDIAGLFGHPLPDTYRRAGLYSAELVKGGASTLYGSNAIAGVLDLRSFYRPDLDRYTNLELTGGSWDTYNGMLQHSQRFDNLILAGWYEYIESDNHRVDNEYYNRSGGFRAQYDASEKFSTFITGKYSSFDYADTGPEYHPAKFTGDIQRMGATLGADFTGGRYSASARVYSSYGEHAFSDGFQSVDRNNGVSLYGRARQVGLKGLSLSGGMSVNYLGGSAYNGTGFIMGGDFNEIEYAAHLQSELDLNEIVHFTIGGRYIDHDRYDDHLVYQAGAVISPPDWGSFKLSVGSAYRNPTVNESQLFAISNADSLKPEEGTFYEVGYFNRLGRRFSIETAVFWREGENLIESIANPSPPPANLFQNAGSYSHSGWEATVRYADDHWSLSPSFVHLNQDNYNGSVPEDKFVLSGSFHADQLTVGFETVAAFNTASDSAGVPVVLDDYRVMNLDTRYALTDLVDLKLRVENLFDEEYQVVHGYPMPGITFRGGFAVRFK